MMMARFLGSIAVAALAVSGVVADTVNLKQKPVLQYIQYSSVPGYFLQDNSSTNPSTFDFVWPIPLSRLNCPNC